MQQPCLELSDLETKTDMASEFTFPSLDWLQAVREVFNTTDMYRGAGSGRCDCVVGLKIEGAVFIVEFEGFGCTGVRQANEAELENVDFYLDMPYELWKSMLENISANNHAIGEFTLNTLDLGMEQGIAHSKHEDQYRQDLFVRYNQTMQFFFDASHRISTTFEEIVAS